MEGCRFSVRPSALATAAVASLCSAHAGEAGDLKRADVVGTWRLVSVETLRPNGGVSHEWMGRNLLGLIVYDATGHMAVQIMRDPRPSFGPGHQCCIPERTATPMRSRAFGDEPAGTLLTSADVAARSLDVLLSSQTGHVIDIRRDSGPAALTGG